MHCLAWLADSLLGEDLRAGKLGWENCERAEKRHRIKISNRRATQRYNVSAFFYAKICSSLARRRSSQPVQCVYWPENVIDWLGKWRPTCVMREDRNFKASDVSGPSIWIFILWKRAFHDCPFLRPREVLSP